MLVQYVVGFVLQKPNSNSRMQFVEYKFVTSTISLCCSIVPFRSVVPLFVCPFPSSFPSPIPLPSACASLLCAVRQYKTYQKQILNRHIESVMSRYMYRFNHTVFINIGDEYTKYHIFRQISHLQLLYRDFTIFQYDTYHTSLAQTIVKKQDAPQPCPVISMSKTY